MPTQRIKCKKAYEAYAQTILNPQDSLGNKVLGLAVNAKHNGFKSDTFPIGLHHKSTLVVAQSVDCAHRFSNINNCFNPQETYPKD